jgi:hypothetical protein
MLQYERTLCLILMLQYGRALSVSFILKWNSFTIRNANRDSFYCLLSNGCNNDICNLMYLYISWYMNFLYRDINV